MRHGKRNNALGRKTAHRKAMLENMACSLIEHKRINTTVAKAKELRKFVEPIITRSKEDSTHNRREVFKNLQSKNAVTEVFREIAPKVAQREGGYTRIIKLGTRMGDSAEMAMIELVDFNELMLKDSNTKTRRSRRGGKKKETEATSEAPAVEETAKAEEPKADEAIVEAPPEDKEAKAEATIPEAKEESKAVEPKTDESKEEDKKD
ncbi:MAG: large subunit ribosomal protein L17 [Cryomorphaceae bacterium]|jgi:large subunit ribosomal protein L17